tara:strand:+ start:2316 stop:2471 length:156 start_codon:yes stop_codon:yes gene_type:complete
MEKVYKKQKKMQKDYFQSICGTNFTYKLYSMPGNIHQLEDGLLIKILYPLK